EATELSAEQIRREIHQHVPVIDFADVRDVGKNFAPDGDAFLHNPHAILRRKRALNGHAPVGFTVSPAEGYARAAIFIAGLEDQVLSFLTDKSEQVDVLAVV